MLKDFTVIEIRKRVGPMQMIIEPKRLRFSRHVIEALEYSPFVHFLINARDKKLAIQVCREKGRSGHALLQASGGAGAEIHPRPE